jgi:hypothetical protein
MFPLGEKVNESMCFDDAITHNSFINDVEIIRNQACIVWNNQLINDQELDWWGN